MTDIADNSGRCLTARATHEPNPQAVSALRVGIANAPTERLALNLRAYAHSRGAPRKGDDEAAALDAARKILAATETNNAYTS